MVELECMFIRSLSLLLTGDYDCLLKTACI